MCCRREASRWRARPIPAQLSYKAYGICHCWDFYNDLVYISWYFHGFVSQIYYPCLSPSIQIVTNPLADGFTPPTSPDMPGPTTSLPQKKQVSLKRQGNGLQNRQKVREYTWCFSEIVTTIGSEGNVRTKNLANVKLHTPTGMIGYCMKDRKQPWFEAVVKVVQQFQDSQLLWYAAENGSLVDWWSPARAIDSGCGGNWTPIDEGLY